MINQQHQIPLSTDQHLVFNYSMFCHSITLLALCRHHAQGLPQVTNIIIVKVQAVQWHDIFHNLHRLIFSLVLAIIYICYPKLHEMKSQIIETKITKKKREQLLQPRIFFCCWKLHSRIIWTLYLLVSLWHATNLFQASIFSWLDIPNYSSNQLLLITVRVFPFNICQGKIYLLITEVYVIPIR